jgi:nucleoside-diphosphate-sugar epimerase
MRQPADSAVEGTAATRVVVVGGSGSIGLAVSEELGRDFDVLSLTRFDPPADSPANVTWRHCDLFAPEELEGHLAGRDVAVYLVHTRLPSARLDQAKCEDMDLIIADNVARAAARQGIRQIICLRGLISDSDLSPENRARREEVVEALGAYGTPVTVLRASLVVAPGASTVNLIKSLVDGARFLPVPRWANHPKQPIALKDLLRAVRCCLSDPSLAGGEFEIGGPVVTDWRGILARAAELLNEHPRIVTLRWCPRWLYARWIRWRDRSVHPALAQLLVADLEHSGVARENPLQARIEADALPPGEAIAPFLRDAGRRRLQNPRSAQLPAYRTHLRAARKVRSIQRMCLPAGRDEQWLASHYFEWLGRVMRPFVACRTDAQGNYAIGLRWPGITLLRLTLDTRQDRPGRRNYFITGGVLADRERNDRGRMEFHTVLDGRYCIVAIHDFAPSLPWNFYHGTQAMAHGIVMGLFQRHMKGLAARGA